MSAANTMDAAAMNQQQPMGSGMGGGGGAYQPTASDVLLDLALRTFFDFIQRALAAPIDRMMVLSATEGELVRQGRLPAKGFGGVWACLKRVWKKEGVTGFFRGLGADFALSLPSGFVDAFSTNAVFFCLQRCLPGSFANSMTYTQVLVVSMLATTASVAVASPYNALRKSIMTNYMADIVAPVGSEKNKKAEKQSEEIENEEEEPASPMGEAYRYATATETARSIHCRQGWSAFYRGAVVDPIVICAYRGIYVATVALVSPNVQVMYPAAVARGMALVADLLTQPLEVVSRRLLLTASDDVHAPYKGMVDCARQIANTEGATALWSGLKFRLLTSVGTVALQLLFTGGRGLE